jgi:signal transduction histidine kinase
LSDNFQQDISSVQAISAVPNILDVVCRMTGMGFAAVARVTEDRWIACQVLDNVHFGLVAGGELKIETTICNEIRDHHQIVVIDNVSEDPKYRDHHTPRIYGLQSYISVPIILPSGKFFGTLCAIDTKPARINTPETIGTFKLFAELIAYHLDANDRLRETQEQLGDERHLSDLREQFIAVLGHDLRNPIAALHGGIDRLLRRGWDDSSPVVLRMMKTSLNRMTGLVDNVMDLARARMGGGILLDLNEQQHDVSATLEQVIAEFRTAQPERAIETFYKLSSGVAVDHARLAQMFSNLLGNALTHGSEDKPISIHADVDGDLFTLSVVNGGLPIPPEKIERLFQPFHRGDSNTQGLGLGLYIASEIAKAHGGTLEVNSDESETRFTFRMQL